jgi:hypothetical protein
MSWRKSFGPRVERRTLLAGLGIASLAPFVPLLNASAQEAIPKRLLLFFTPHGTIWDAWVPQGSETDFSLGPILQPLERHKKKLAILAGISMRDVGSVFPHTKGLPRLWTGSNLLENKDFSRGGLSYGFASNASVDQYISQKLGGQSLEFGVRCKDSHPAKRMIYKGPNQPVAPATDPWEIFNRLFTGGASGGPSGEALLAERKSVLDLVQAELGALNQRVSKADQFKIAAHLEAIRATETRLVEQSATRASALNGPELGTKVDPNHVSNTPAILDRQLELITSVFAADLSRVASLQYNIGDVDANPYPWLGFNGDHHLTTHRPDSDIGARNNLIKIYTWYAERFAYLLDKLDAIPEGNGTMLDNCIVVWGSEVGKGNNHTASPAPFIAAGGGSGAFKTGRFLQYDPKSAIHNRLLVSICHAMGVDDVTTYGLLDTGQGALAGFLA